jgi:tetratricopeptide (TPR) repeat protein
MKAIRWLEHLEKLSEGSYRPDEVSNYLAFSNLCSGLQEKTGELRKKHLRKAVQRFAALADKGVLDYQGYFWLAYAQDELGQWYEAILSNFETLKRRPRHAPARYNLADSLLKLGKCGGALRQLKKIGPQDEQIDKATAAIAASTDEMRRKIVACGPTVQEQLLKELDRLSGLGAKLPPHP